MVGKPAELKEGFEDGNVGHLDEGGMRNDSGSEGEVENVEAPEERSFLLDGQELKLVEELDTGEDEGMALDDLRECGGVEVKDLGGDLEGSDVENIEEQLGGIRGGEIVFLFPKHCVEGWN